MDEGRGTSDGDEGRRPDPGGWAGVQLELVRDSRAVHAHKASGLYRSL